MKKKKVNISCVKEWREKKSIHTIQGNEQELIDKYLEKNKISRYDYKGIKS